MIDNYNALPLGLYLKILDIPADLPEYDYKVRVVALLAGIEEDELLDQPLTKTMKMAAAAGFLTTPIPKGDGKRLASCYKLGGLELIPTKDVRKWTTAQFVDFQTFAAKKEAATLPELYSCVLVPKGCTYGNGYDIADVHKAVRDFLPVTAAMEISAFFLRRFLDYCSNILTSSLRSLRRVKDPKTMEVKKKAQALLPLLKSGAGLLT